MSIQLTTGILQQIKNRGSAVIPILLEAYPNASAAYSLFQLKTDITSVVRVRRSSDNAQADFTAAEITNGTLTTWTGANDGFVVTWYDQSGNNLHYTQPTPSNQPKLVTTGVLELDNGSPVIDFGVNQALTRLIQDTPLVNQTNGYYSQFIVAKSYGEGTANGWYYLSQQGTTSVGRYIETPLSVNLIRQTRFKVGTTISPHSPSQSFTQANAQNQFLASGICGDSFIDISVNGSTPTSIATDNDYALIGTGNSFIGTNALNGAQGHKVRIGLILFYPEVKTSDRNGITSVINNLYNVY